MLLIYTTHTLIHFTAGASLFFLIYNRDFSSRRKRSTMLLAGGIAGIIPDIMKISGNLLGHSILFVPVYGLVLAIVFQLLLKNLPVKKMWMPFSVTVLGAHLLIDYIGNGAAFLYPIITRSFDFGVINKNDYFILLMLTVVVIAAIFNRRGRLIIGSGIIAVGVYLTGLTISKIQLNQSLQSQYPHATHMDTYPAAELKWGYVLETNKGKVHGYAPILENNYTNLHAGS